MLLLLFCALPLTVIRLVNLQFTVCYNKREARLRNEYVTYKYIYVNTHVRAATKQQFNLIQSIHASKLNSKCTLYESFFGSYFFTAVPLAFPTLYSFAFPFPFFPPFTWFFFWIFISFPIRTCSMLVKLKLIRWILLLIDSIFQSYR